VREENRVVIDDYIRDVDRKNVVLGGRSFLCRELNPINDWIGISHGVTTQETNIDIFTAVRTSNLMKASVT
jgi:hypothetical protein